MASSEKQRAAARRWYARLSPEEKRALMARKTAYAKSSPKARITKRKFALRRQGIDLDSLPSLWPPEGAVCEICRKPEELVPDHHHGSGKFRGWLCSKCNTSLGMMDDDAERCRAAARYLAR